MLSVQQPSSTKSSIGHAEHSPHRPSPLGTLSPPPSPRQSANVGNYPSSPRTGVPGEGLDQWFEELQKHEATLGAMATASEDPKFREELSTIEQWFTLLSVSEQTATLYTLMQHTNTAQAKFLSAVMQQMAGNPNTPAPDNASKMARGRGSLRPPSLNLPLPGSPSTPRFNTPATASLPSAMDSSRGPGSQLSQIPEGQDLVVNNNSQTDNSWASMVSTPLVPMFQKGSETTKNANPQGMAGMVNPMLNPFNMSMLSNMGFTQEAQILAVQMVMSGLVQPLPQQNVPQKQGNAKPQRSKDHPSGSNSWRGGPSSAKYPGSALRSAGLKSSGLKSNGLRSSGLKSASSIGSMATPSEEDIDPEMLKDIPAWLKSLRLHKYTSCFDGMTWEDMVALDDAALEGKGIVALGARRRLLKTFNLVKKKMGMEYSEDDVVTPGVPASATVASASSLRATAPPFELTAPHSAAP